ncbi:uncharacterized protein B0P05DRAFT_571670 [Gilbertella persicaria]|uniref:uncharacterized protein n=1 Tax=Gilbertella persicaria TaxID=101096 RepID=UPI00221F24AA|nr:uncharacterized protein B0P05DRAFT_571670 [Gilbertella persicaria]KAI8078994.1 hypothetical protein B0P05DRAFT_571670 [Gilbertella persicaria]
MSYAPYDSYLSNLDSLVFDSPNEVDQSEKEAAEELDLWSNAQFTFDVKPGVGIYDEEKKTSPVSTPATQFEVASGGLDAATYDALVNYLDYELPRQQQVKMEQQQQQQKTPIVKKQRVIQPRPLAPALPTTTSIAPLPVPIAARQVLMPKPPVVPANIFSTLLASQQQPLVPKKTTAGVKRPATEEPELKTEENVNPDEDKRRRNTAASARFRIKKKMREQAMEESVREMTIKSDKLQDRVNQLESEIKFLRSLLLDKTKQQ